MNAREATPSGRQHGEQEDQRAESERDRAVLEAARDGQRAVGDRAAAPAAREQLVERLRGRSGLADGEHEPARDRVAVGGDDAERRRVGPVAEAGLELDRDLGALAARGGRPCRPAPPGRRVEHPQRAEAGLDRLVELEHDLAPARASSCAPRSGTVDCSVACENAVAGRASSAARASASARFTTPRRPPRARPSAGGARRTRRARARSRARRSRRSRRSEASPASSGTHVSVPAIAPFCSPICDRDLPVVELRRTSLSFSCGGSPLPIQCARWSCHSNRPLLDTCFHAGSAGKVLRHRGLAQAVLVEVVRLRAGVDLDRAVGEHAARTACPCSP